MNETYLEWISINVPTPGSTETLFIKSEFNVLDLLWYLGLLVVYDTEIEYIENMSSKTFIEAD